MQLSGHLLAWAILLLAGLFLFLSSWIVIPAPIFALLPLGVGAPEISPLLLLGNGILLGLSLCLRLDTPLRFIAIALSTAGLVLSSLPLLQLPATLQRAEAQMQAALGPDYATRISPRLQPYLRSHPFVPLAFVQGLPNPSLQPQRQTWLASDGTPLKLDIYQPPQSTSLGALWPVIVTIYGGAWQRGEPKETARFSTYMAAQGYAVVAIDYRHAPQHRFPAQLEDVQAALVWLVEQAPTYGFDPNRLALVGWSAGAHLAMLAAFQPGAVPVQAVVSYYGPVDLPAGYRNPPVPDPINSRAVLEAFLGGTPEQLPDLYQQASPIHYIRPGLPPTLLIYGQRDHIVKPLFGRQLHSALQAEGNSAALVLLPWSEHAFDAVFRGLGNQLALYYTERFLAQRLKLE
jgi:acetyl esterase/lipase